MATLSPEQKRKAVYKAALQAAAKQRASEVRPDFFRDFLPHVQIRSDDPYNPVPITFDVYDYQREVLESWLDRNSEVILKGRQLGISWTNAAYQLYRAMVDGWNLGYFSYKEQFARDHLRDRIRFIWQRLPKKLDVDGVSWPLPDARWTADEATFSSGGGISVFPSTPDAGVGYTFQGITMDEFSLHEYASQNYASLKPTLAPGAQIIIFSTSNPQLGPHGDFYDMWKHAEERGYGKRFIPWNARPGRDTAAYETVKASYMGMESEFKAHHPLVENDAFEGKSGLVFPQFVDAYPFVQELTNDWGDYKFRVAGVDPGGGDPTAIVPLGITNGWVFEQPYEFYKRGPVTLDEIFDWLWHLHQQAPFDYIWVDAPRKSPTVAQLQWRGLPVYGANKDRGAGLAMHAWALDNRRLILAPRCVNSRAEFAGYMWPERTDPNTKDKYRTGTPVDNHADAMDARRYAILGAFEAIRRGTNAGAPAIEYNRTPKHSDPWEARKKPPGVTFTRR